MKMVKNALAAVVDAVTPKPTLAQLAERLRTARTKLAEARKITPNEPDGLAGLPRADLVEAAIACCKAAGEVRDAELAFVQGDTESDEIYAALAKTLSAKADEAPKLEAAVKAAQEALNTFCSGVDADVENAAGQLQALSRRRAAENLPGARSNLHKPEFRELLGDLELAKAAEWLSQPVPGRDPSQGDYIASRIKDIEKGHAERERKEALACLPTWQVLPSEKDEWVQRWCKADSAEREELKAYARGERRGGLFPHNHYPRS